MAQPELRAFFGIGDVTSTVVEHQPAAPEGVTVRLGDIAALLADAVHSDRTWLYDFQDDEITLSSDLYEVLIAYQFLRRGRNT